MSFQSFEMRNAENLVDRKRRQADRQADRNDVQCWVVTELWPCTGTGTAYWDSVVNSLSSLNILTGG